ncbi:hypothetical protein H4R18_005380 [Coemansia javaensis]|uniref:AA9 family lytic polysaccharide monooxygenase n=1 Tax=Coemansia javaensis TaxID=2761396 RepID=A0A9W8H7Y7_9FUNG|nr:hypothetical protein H4R18_005380 [Coemansia javaensis]
MRCRWAAAAGCCIVLGATAVHAHTKVTAVVIEGKELGEQECIRPWTKDSNTPVFDPADENLRCRTNQMDASKTKVCAVKAGSTIKVLWTESGKGSRAISDSHRGPFVAYMSPMEANGEGPVWFKIAEDGYDGAKDIWATDTIIKNKGYVDLTIPADLKPGQYLLRPEIIALHEANRKFGADSKAGAQFYPNCIQLTVEGTGTSVPAGVAIPGIYKPEDKGLFYDLWAGLKTYPIPGPEVYKAGSAPAPASSNSNVATNPNSGTTNTTTTTTTAGRPCVRKNPARRRRLPERKRDEI